MRAFLVCITLLVVLTAVAAEPACSSDQCDPHISKVCDVSPCPRDVCAALAAYSQPTVLQCGSILVIDLPGIDTDETFYFDSATHELIGLRNGGNGVYTCYGPPGFSPPRVDHSCPYAPPFPECAAASNGRDGGVDGAPD